MEQKIERERYIAKSGTDKGWEIKKNNNENQRYNSMLKTDNSRKFFFHQRY